MHFDAITKVVILLDSLTYTKCDWKSSVFKMLTTNSKILKSKELIPQFPSNKWENKSINNLFCC